jgi:hypothetical protein
LKEPPLDLGAWSEGAQTALVLAGAVLGSFAIGSAAWVWLKWQMFGFAGTALCGSGALLLGLSLWHSLAFDLEKSREPPLKLQASLDKIAKLATDQTETVRDVHAEVAQEKQALRDLAAQMDALRAKCDASRRASTGSVGANEGDLESAAGARLSALLDKVRYNLMMWDPKEALRNLVLLKNGLRSAEWSFKKRKIELAEPIDIRALDREINDVIGAIKKYLVQGYKAEQFDSLEYNIVQRRLDDVEHGIATLESARNRMESNPAAPPG